MVIIFDLLVFVVWNPVNANFVFFTTNVIPKLELNIVLPCLHHLSLRALLNTEVSDSSVMYFTDCTFKPSKTLSPIIPLPHCQRGRLKVVRVQRHTECIPRNAYLKRPTRTFLLGTFRTERNDYSCRHLLPSPLTLSLIWSGSKLVIVYEIKSLIALLLSAVQ